jgi:ATP-dependent RNA helicase DeaD
MVTILKESLDEIIAELPAAHKTLLFSATMREPLPSSANMETVGNQGIDHEYIVVDPIEN